MSEATSESKSDRNTRRVETGTAYILRGGVVLSLALVLAGIAVEFARNPAATSPAEFARLTAEKAPFPHTPAAVWEGLRAGRGQAIIALGLLLLVATPVVRVAASVATFVYERDWAFAVITGAVLALLLLSFYLGKAG